MIILTDCLSEKIDEGAIKVANSLTERVKKYYPDTTVVSYKNPTQKSDVHLKLNKLFLNKSLVNLVSIKKEPVLYIPFSSNTKASILRTFILSRFCRWGLHVMFVLRHPMGKIYTKLLRESGAKVWALSHDSWQFYKEIVKDTAYLKTGIDTTRFSPVTVERKKQLRQKYKISEDAKIALHVGHLNYGRNVDKLLLVPKDYHVILVVSSVTKQDEALRRKLESSSNITIVDSYMESIEEIYQLADVYLFLVQEQEHCIDVPLSVLEAASCNIPIVATKYGELKSFQGYDGFFFIEQCDYDTLNDAIKHFEEMSICHNRECVLAYDWETSVEYLMRGNHAEI